MSDWVATAEAMPVRLTRLFQFLSPGLGLAGLLGCVLLVPIALAERGSHIPLDKPYLNYLVLIGVAQCNSPPCLPFLSVPFREKGNRSTVQL